MSDERVTMHDVARLAGVSLKTVSNVINGYRYLRPETRARVEAAIETLGYRVNMSARNLRRGRTGLIKLVVPELRNPYFAEFADSVVQAAYERDLVVLLEHYHDSREREIEVLKGGYGQQVDGVLFSPVHIGQEEAGLFKVDFPLVILGETIFNAPRDHVTMRNIEGAYAQVRHLLALGREKIAVIGFNEVSNVSSATLRFRGATRAFADAGLAVDPRLVAGPGPWERSSGARLMGQVLDGGARPDGVVCFNDALAMGATYELLRRGVRVPDDIAIIGFDNIEDTQFSHPTLSTIDPGGAEIARTAVAMLAERMGLVPGFDPATEPREVFADFTLLARESTVGPAGVANR